MLTCNKFDKNNDDDDDDDFSSMCKGKKKRGEEFVELNEFYVFICRLTNRIVTRQIARRITICWRLLMLGPAPKARTS